MLLHRLVADEKGASAAEYAALLAIIGAALALAALALSESIACSIEQSSLVIAGVSDDPNHPRGQSDPNGKAKGHHDHCNQ